MSTVLFNHVIDWIMRRTTEDRNRGIRWTPFSYVEDLDYADDLGLLSHTHSHIQGKTQQLNIFAKQVGLNISSKKTEIMALNTTNRSPVQVENGDPPYIRTGSPILAASSAVKGGRPGHPEPSQQGQKLSYHDEHCMALLHLQHSHQAETLPQLRPHKSSIRFGMLATDREGFNKAVHISHQEPPPNSAHLLAQNHFKQRPAQKVCNRIHGYLPNEETLEVDWPCHPPRSLHHQDCLALDTRGKGKEGRLKITWRRTVENGRSGGIMVLPYTPPDVMGMSE